MLGYQVRSVNAEPSSKPAVIAETQLADQLAAVHIDEQRLVRFLAHHRKYLQRCACRAEIVAGSRL